MTDSAHSTNAPALPRRGFLRKAGAATFALPTLIVASTAAGDADLQRLIEAHRAACFALEEAGSAANDAEEAEEQRLEVVREPVPKIASFKRWYDATLGRQEVLHRLGDDFASAAERMRGSHFAEFLGAGEIDNAVARLETQGQSALADAKRFFDAEDARAAASPVAKLNAAWKAAYQTEDDAYTAVLAHRCRSDQEAAIKAEYIVSTETFQTCGPEEHHFAALIRSALPAM